MRKWIRNPWLLISVAALTVGLTAAVVVQGRLTGSRSRAAPDHPVQDGGSTADAFVPREPERLPEPEPVEEPAQASTERGEQASGPARTVAADSVIGTLRIPAIGLDAQVMQTTDEMEAMEQGVAHFPSTPEWNGNVGLCAHNFLTDGSAGLFARLHQLSAGDRITYVTGQGERTYIVTAVSQVAADDWTPLAYAEANLLTLITCVSGRPDLRLAVRAEETG